jgi:beta-lactamase superfamily II metal-dependent hydrolase
MFRLKIVQALHGDCLVLEHSFQDEQYHLLVDGGPATVYETYLKEELAGIRDMGGKINLAVLSHIDDDHVKGLLDLLRDLVKQRRAGKQETIAISELWHNSFGQTLGDMLEKGMMRQMDTTSLPHRDTPKANAQARSIKQGQDLAVFARGLRIPINAEFRDTSDRVVCVDNIKKPILLGNLKLHVVGPTRSDLLSLQKDWEEWLVKQEKAKKLPAKDAKKATRDLDKSVPNLSSIMLLAEAEGKTVLLTGDGQGEHMEEGLRQAGLLKEDATLHVDVFKLAHHGSMRNVTAGLFERITASTYVICADGTNDNPDYQTLEWLVQAAIKQGRSFHIVATWETDSIKKLVSLYNPENSHYDVTFIDAQAHSITLELSEQPQRV